MSKIVTSAYFNFEKVVDLILINSGTTFISSAVVTFLLDVAQNNGILYNGLLYWAFGIFGLMLVTTGAMRVTQHH